MKIIALCGKAGAGKDSLLQALVASYKKSFHEIVSCTTRPARSGEQDGINYHFLTENDFAQKILNKDMLEYTLFNGWFYGTAISDLSNKKVNIGVFNPSGIMQLLSKREIDLTVYWIRADAKNRLLRQLNRELHPNVDEIIRRYNADEEDFKFMEEIPYIELRNNDKTDFDLCVAQIGNIYGLKQ